MLRRILFLLLLTPTAVLAQVVRGTVIDAGTGAPVKAADVSLFDRSGRRLYRLFSDDEGRFTFVVPLQRAVYIRIENIGYEPLTSKVLSANQGEEIDVAVRLSPHPVPLKGIEVVARQPVDWRLRSFLDRASTYGKSGVGRIWTRADLQRHPIVLPSHILRRVPKRPDILCRGTLAFLDNVQIELEDIDAFVSPDELEGIEIYRDVEIPPELEARAWRWDTRPGTQAVQLGSEMVQVASGPRLDKACRVVLFWRKPFSELYAGRPHRFSWGKTFATVGLVGLIVLESLALR